MSSAQARDHARRIVGALPAGIRDQFATEPFAGLTQAGYALRLRPEPEISGDCSVAGSYDAGPPPTINVVQAASIGRQYFTALHEFGHRLVASDTAVHDVFFDQRDGGRRLEEDVCDAIAAELLLRDEVVDRHIGANGPTARAVVALVHDTAASREACCVRAAQHIIGVGHVMLARDGVAQFTASRGTPYRVRRGTTQAGDHITQKAARWGSYREEAAVTYASGAISDRFFADAAADDDGYVIAVFMDTRPPWMTGVTLFSGDRTDPTEAYCTHCEVDFTTLAAPCPACRDYRHMPGCGACSCAPVILDRLCQECFLRRPVSNFTGGSSVCDICLGD